MPHVGGYRQVKGEFMAKGHCTVNSGIVTNVLSVLVVVIRE